MKTHNFCMFMLTAFFCGALFCVPANAKVCFVGDEDCGAGSDFSSMTPPDTVNLCIQEKYDTKASACANIGGVCPYDANYVRCCPSEYAYQACVYPLETVTKMVDGKPAVDKCGSLYKCQCPSEYGVTSEYAQKNNCQPGGGYCLLNDGTTDQVKYKTCTCDSAVYTDEDSCKNNQSEEASCTNEKGDVRKKCYCDRTIYPYASCEYGNKGTVCLDSNINREYYSACKSARERCLEENYVAENLTQCPQGESACTSTISGRKYYCALGDGCPYPVVPQLYKCQFDKGRWCKNNGYAQESSTPVVRNSTCTDTETGLQGKSEPCPENTDTPTYYYKCKLTCAQRAQYGATRTGDLTQDAALANSGIKAYYNVMGGDKHLYVAEGGVVPTENKENWKDIGSKIDFKSINGIYALCDRDSNQYMECCEERDQYYNRPTLKFDGMIIDAENNFWSKDMSDINVEVYSSSTSESKGFGEKFWVNDNHTWNNVTVTSNTAPDTSSVTYSGDEEKYWRLDNRKNDIRVKGGKTLTFTGLTRFNFARWTWYRDSNNVAMDQYEPSVKAIFYLTHFMTERNSQIRFDNAEILGTGASWDGDNATLLFLNTSMYSSSATLGHIWSYWNVGLKNSTVNIDMLRIGGWKGSTYSFPSSINSAAATGNGREHARYRCHGAYLYNSTLNILENYNLIHNQYSKIFIDYRSKLISAKPIQLRGTKSDMVCVESGGTLTVAGSKLSYSSNTMFYGWNSDGRFVGGSKDTAFRSTTTQEWYNRFKDCDANGKNCKWPTNPICTSSGWFTDNGDGHNVAFYPNATGSVLCTACNTCSLYGMGFN